MKPAVSSAQHALTSIPQIRPFKGEDLAFVASTWKQSYWRESAWANRIRWSVFSPGHDAVIRRLLQRSTVLVACDPEAPDEIVGYIVFEKGTDLVYPGAVHFIYIKPVFRKAGVGRALLAATELPADLSGVTITHGTRAWFSAPPLVDKRTERILKPGRPGLEEKFRAIYDPYRWFGGGPDAT